MLLLIDTYGARISVQNKCFAVIKDEASKIISPQRVEAIWISKTARVSTRVFQLAAAFSIPVLILGKQLIWMQHNAIQNNAQILRQQVYFTNTSVALAFITDNIFLKIQQQMQVLIPYQNKEKKIAYAVSRMQQVSENIRQQYEKIRSVNQPITGIQIKNAYIQLRSKEAHASKYYWRGIDIILGEDNDFEQRQKRGATDPFNVTLNYMYAILYSTITQAILTLKLSPYLGLMHAERIGHTALTYDLIEPYRAYIDQLVIGLFKDEVILGSHFQITTIHTTIDKAGRKILAESFFTMLYKRQKIDGEKISILSHIMKRVQGLQELITQQTIPK